MIFYFINLMFLCFYFFCNLYKIVLIIINSFFLIIYNIIDIYNKFILFFQLILFEVIFRVMFFNVYKIYYY